MIHIYQNFSEFNKKEVSPLLEKIFYINFLSDHDKQSSSTKSNIKKKIRIMLSKKSNGSEMKKYYLPNEISKNIIGRLFDLFVDDFINYGIFCEVGIHQYITTIPVFPYRDNGKFLCNEMQFDAFINSHIEYIIDPKCMTRTNASRKYIACICDSCNCPNMRHGHYECPNCNHICQLKIYLSNPMKNGEPDISDTDICLGCAWHRLNLRFDTETASFSAEQLRARSPAEN